MVDDTREKHFTENEKKIREMARSMFRHAQKNAPDPISAMEAGAVAYLTLCGMAMSAFVPDERGFTQEEAEEFMVESLRRTIKQVRETLGRGN